MLDKNTVHDDLIIFRATWLSTYKQKTILLISLLN